MAAGDSFEYRICDSQYGPHAPPRPGHGGGWACYRAVLHVEAVVPVSGGRGGGIGAGADVHVVRAEVDWGGGAGDAGASPRGPLEAVLLVVDGGGGRLAVRHADPADRPVAESLQRTVFWRGGLGGGVALAYGEPAAELVRGHPSTALLVTGSRVSADGLVEYTAEHGPPTAAPPRLDGAGWRERAGQGTSSIVVAAGVGLPVSARVYAGLQPPLDHYHPGRPLFEYEMASFEQASARVARAGQAGAGDGGNGGTPRETAAEEGAPIANPHYSVHGGARRGRSLPRRGRGPAAGAARNGGGRGAW